MDKANHKMIASNIEEAISIQVAKQLDAGSVANTLWNPVAQAAAESKLGQVLSKKPKMDPEKEKAHVALMKRLSVAEARREVLETMYMSLRSHYVVAENNSARGREAEDGMSGFLRDLVARRAVGVGVKRAKLNVLRGLKEGIEERMKKVSPPLRFPTKI